MMNLWLFLGLGLLYTIVCARTLLESSPSTFLDNHRLCSRAFFQELTAFTKHDTCEDLLLKEMIPSPLSSSLYTGEQYDQLSINLINAVKRGVLRIGILGGSVSEYWPHPLKVLAADLFSTIGTNFNGTAGETGTLVQVMNGAVAGTGPPIPTGCAPKLLGDVNMDVIILEYAINDRSEANLRALVQVLQRNYVNAAIMILHLTSRRVKQWGWPGEWAGGANVARDFHLSYLNWSDIAEIGYNKTYDPALMWTDKDQQHPVRLGWQWIAGSVLLTMEAVYRHNSAVRDSSQVALPLARLPDAHPHVDHRDMVCISEFCTGKRMVPRDLEGIATAEIDTNFDTYATAGACWGKKYQFPHAHADTTRCQRLVKQFNASACSSEADSMISFNLTVHQRCRFFVAIVGNPLGPATSRCNLDVLLQNPQPGNSTAKVIGKVRMAVTAFIVQTPVEAASLYPGAQVVSLVPAKRDLTPPGAEEPPGDVCNLSTVMCLPY